MLESRKILKKKQKSEKINALFLRFFVKTIDSHIAGYFKVAR